MKRNTSKLHASLLLWGSLIASAVSSAFAPVYATEAKPESIQKVTPCAVVDRFAGDAQVLDEARTRVVEADNRVPVYCGGWVSVENGWLTLKHRFGYQIHVGPHSFVQFLDDADAIAVFRGQIFAQASGGMGELRVVTPNARMRVSRGSIVTLFDPEEEMSQLTVVDGKADFENRFDTTKKANVAVKSGFASALDFKLMRVVPSIPKVVATSSLKAKLLELHVPLKESERALAIARNRRNELFASFEKSQDEQLKPARKIASAEKPSATPVKHSPKAQDSEENQARSEDYLLRKTLGGSADGMKILRRPAAHRKKTQKAKVQVEDPEAQLMAKQKGAEDKEKRRLIEELSKIHSD
jgi:hypothetical protein